MSLTKKVYLTISGYDIKLSDNLTFYQKDQLKLIFYINEYGIDYENNATTRALMPVNPLNAILFIENPDGVDSVSSAKIEDNAVTFYLDSTHTQYVGVSRMQLRLFDQDGCAITLPHFTFEIRENIYGSGDIRFQNVVMVDQTGTVILTEDNDMLDVGDVLTMGTEVAYPQVTKTIKELPIKHGLDGTEKLIVEDEEATKQAPLGIIVDEIKQNSQEKIREIESELAQTNAQLSHKASYPILEGEIGVVDVTKPYGDVKRYGANKPTRNMDIDDSPFFQNAIDSAQNIGCSVTVSRGIYCIKNTLFLPKVIKITGTDKKVSYRGQTDGTVIETEVREVFKPKESGVTSLTLEGLYFYSRDELAVLFSGFNFINTFITKNNFHCYSVVMLSGIGGGQSRFADNDIQMIGKSCFCAKPDENSGISTVAPAGIVDACIDNNYINGNQYKNAVGIDGRGYAIASSKITNNYIDFFKYAFFNPETNLYTNNIIDHCFRGFAGRMSGCIIANNYFLHISKKRIGRFPNADDQMKTQDWTCISSSNVDGNLCGNYAFNMTASNNIINGCDVFFNSEGCLKSGIKILQQSYCDENIIKVKNFIKSGEWDSSWVDNLNGVYIEPLMRIKVDTLPNARLTAYVSNTFNGHEIIYKNKILTNIDGVWRDSAGNEVTS